jgi:hypothetical protein
MSNGNISPYGMRDALMSFLHNMTKNSQDQKTPPRTAKNSTLKSIKITRLATQIGLAYNTPRTISTITCDNTAPAQKYPGYLTKNKQISN